MTTTTKQTGKLDVIFKSGVHHHANHHHTKAHQDVDDLLFRHHLYFIVELRASSSSYFFLPPNLHKQHYTFISNSSFRSSHFHFHSIFFQTSLLIKYRRLPSKNYLGFGWKLFLWLFAAILLIVAFCLLVMHFTFRNPHHSDSLNMCNNSVISIARIIITALLCLL